MTSSHVWLKRTHSQWRGEAPTGPRREGFFGFLRDDIVPLALFSGLSCTLGVIPYTTFLSQQTYECPSWALKCQVYSENLGTFQGAVTLVYTIGLMCLAYACWALAEVSLWPLLCRQSFTHKQIDRFLAVSRGSVPAIPLAFGIIKRWETCSVIICAVFVTLTSLSAGPVVGYVFDQPSLSTAYEGELFVGGGSSAIFHQQNPPVYSDVTASGFYSDWFSGFNTTEPMPKYRDWIVDRQSLSSRGNFTARAVMIRKSISCDAFRVLQTTGPNSGGRNQLYFHTMLANVTDRNNPNAVGSESVAVYNTRLLSVWVHNVQFVSNKRTRATLVFAVPGGILEGSSTSFLNTFGLDHYSNISATACEIDIELMDDILVVGDGGIAQSPLPTLSCIKDMEGGNQIAKNATKNDPMYGHGELALLFAVAPATVGNGYAGNQPAFVPLSNGETHGRLVASGNTGGKGHGPWNYVWRRRQIEDLIDGSIGALTLAMSLRVRDTRVNMKSVVFVHHMEPSRNAILAVPVAILLMIWSILAWLTRLFHRQSGLRVVRMGETADLFEAWQKGLVVQDNKADSDVVRVMYQNNGQDDSDFVSDASISKSEKSDLDVESAPNQDDQTGTSIIDDKAGEISG